MNDSGVSHGIYTSRLISLIALVNGFKDKNIHLSGEDLSAFKDAIENGSLPQYAFIEPKYFGEHNDQHPSSAGAAMTLESTEEIKTVQQTVSYLESIQSLLKDID